MDNGKLKWKMAENENFLRFIVDNADKIFFQGDFPYLNFCHFLHSAFSTLHVFYTPPFLHSAFSTLRIFYTPHFPHSAFSTLLTPSSTLRVFYWPIADGPLNFKDV